MAYCNKILWSTWSPQIEMDIAQTILRLCGRWAMRNRLRYRPTYHYILTSFFFINAAQKTVRPTSYLFSKRGLPQLH